MKSARSRIVKAYARMWPREIFDIRGPKNELLPELRGDLEHPGVYILYHDGQPYYIGKATRSLFHRIWAHANQPRNRHYYFWNFFSAFVIPKKRHIADVEGMLIAGALASGNNATPRFPPLPLPKQVADAMRDKRIRGLTTE